MAVHSNILAWEIPLTEEPGGLQFMGLQNSQAQLSTTRPLQCNRGTKGDYLGNPEGEFDYI